MIYNPISEELFTDDHIFIKKLFCPFQMNWEQLQVSDNKTSKICQKCQHAVIDSHFFSDDEIWTTVQNEPNTCIKIDFEQSNIKISYTL